MLSQVKVIGFDLDDTLWPCMPVINQAEKVLYQWLARHYPRVTDSFSPTQMVEQRLLFSEREPRYRVDLSALRLEFLHHLGETHDYKAEQVADDGFEIFFEARQQVEFFDDVLPVLGRLKQRFRLGGISNGNASIEGVGLGHLIEHLISASDLKIAKPDGRIFEALSDHFQVLPKQIVYVGDHPQYDVAAPLKAGMQAIWINRTQLEWPQDLAQPEHQISDLLQLEAMLT